MPITVIILTTYCDAEYLCHLRACLDHVLAQQYDDFEVVVALYPKTIEMAEPMLEQMELTTPNLRHVTVPSATRFIQSEQMAITLATRAARCEWIVLTQSDCMPTTPHWLQSMSKKMTADVDAIAAYANYRNDFTGGRATLRRASLNVNTLSFARRDKSSARHAKQLNYIYYADTCNVAFRRSTFLNSGGFHNLVGVNDGAMQLWLNTLHRVDAVEDADACVLQQMPDEFKWHNIDATTWRQIRKRLTNTKQYRRNKLLLAYLPLLLLPLYPIYLAVVARRFNKRVVSLGGQSFGFSAWSNLYKN